MEEKNESAFTVTDRRFSAGQQQGEDTTGAAGRQHGAKPEVQEERRGEGAAPRVEEIDFASFLLSLATTAQMNLGNVPNPETGTTATNLQAAKQFIDIIAMLKEKTKGNLTEHEQNLVDNVLFTLRMQYVKVAEGKHSAS